MEEATSSSSTSQAGSPLQGQLTVGNVRVQSRGRARAPLGMPYAIPEASLVKSCWHLNSYWLGHYLSPWRLSHPHEFLGIVMGGFGL